MLMAKSKKDIVSFLVLLHEFALIFTANVTPLGGKKEIECFDYLPKVV